MKLNFTTKSVYKEALMKHQNAILILGYNNTRINDVRKIQETAKRTLNAITVLCKKSPSKEDENAADFVIDVDLNSDNKNLDIVMGAVRNLAINIVAILPFSDPGTQLGSLLALKLGLRGPDINKVDAALNKHAFRQAERNAKFLPNSYKPIKAEQIESFDQLSTLYKKLNGKIFLKPSSEGNSRGCINLSYQCSLEKAWAEVIQYMPSGVIAEELVSNADEYSWDHVSGFSWITEKKTTQNQYRAEIQQIVPAPLSGSTAAVINESGQFMSFLSGSNHGACHNEVFFSDTLQIAKGVEPNLRPAGMRIWDLASLAYENFDPWKEWLLWAADTSSLEILSKNLKQKCFAGLRMITAQKDGVLKNIPVINLNQLCTDHVQLVELVWTKKTNDFVTSNIKDNSDFVGYIIATSTDYQALSTFLDSTTQKIIREVTINDICD